MNKKVLRSSDSQTRGAWLALPATFWLVVFFLIPLLIVFAVSFHTRGLRGTITLPLTLEHYKYVTSEFYWPVFKRSFVIALYTTVICLVFGYPLAFFISSRRNTAYRQILLFLVILPFWTNFLIRTYAWRVFLAREGLLNHYYQKLIAFKDELSFLKFLTLGESSHTPALIEPLQILFTENAVILGMVYGFLPFMVLPIYASMARFNFHLIEAAYDLGGNDWTVFRRVVFPLTLPGVIAGSILVFIPAIGAYVTPDMLGGNEGRMIGNLIARNFERGIWPRGSAASMVLMGIVAVGLLIYLVVAERDSPKKSVHKAENSALASPEHARWLRLPIPQTLRTTFTHYPQHWLDKLYNLRLKLWLSPELQLKRDLWLRRIGTIVLSINPIFCYIFLWLPIIVLVAFSFNDSKSLATWHGFTTQWYDNIMNNVIGDKDARFSTALMLDTLKNSLLIATVATVIATIIGSMVAISLARTKHFGQRSLQGLLYLPVGIPEITMGISLLIFFNRSFSFLNEKWQDLTGHSLGLTTGFITMIIAHVAFNIPYIAVVVQARLASMSQSLEEASRDLGANNWTTFWRITFPLMLPGVVAGGLLAFTISMDDYVVSFYTSGIGTSTLTMYVYGLLKQTVTPEINAISTLMIIASAVLVALSLILQGRNAANSAKR